MTTPKPAKMESHSNNKKEEPSRGRHHKSRPSDSNSTAHRRRSRRASSAALAASRHGKDRTTKDDEKQQQQQQQQPQKTEKRSSSASIDTTTANNDNNIGTSRQRRHSQHRRETTVAQYAESHRHDLMASYLNQMQISRRWVSNHDGSHSESTREGVIICREPGQYVTSPKTLRDSPFAHAMQKLEIQSAMTINSRAIKAWLQANPRAVSLPLSGGSSVQMIPSYASIAKCRIAQRAVFVADQGLLIVWDQDTPSLFQRAVDMEQELADTFCTSEQNHISTITTPAPVISRGEPSEKRGQPPPRISAPAFKQEPLERPGQTVPKIGARIIEREKPVAQDLEVGTYTMHKRPMHVLNALYIGLTLAILTTSLAAGMRQILIQVLTNGDYTRVGLCALIPLQVFFTMFFAQVMIGSIGQIVGPVRHQEGNSRHYSGKLPPRLPTGAHLPRVTIQCPVYKEGLASVIKPTVRSLQAAMTMYERQGGHVNLFVNDDGLQLLGEDERKARIAFYRENNIGWVARPPHGQEGFQRLGKFKKASNMNYAIMVSSKLEQILAKKKKNKRTGCCVDCVKEVEKEDVQQALAEASTVPGTEAWGAGDIRLGDYILLVDSDTRVPADCLLDAVSEMEQSPDVGILQFTSAVMQVAHNFFENGITFFTHMIYSAIKFTVANGDVAPFVGHNAILRWTALQELSYRDKHDEYDKIWSESHVSEDFDMSLRLQANGYTIRLATWGGEDFREGVSLTVYDELARWEKYAYGCNELLFHPMRYWLLRGPFTPLFRRFLQSAIPVPSKLTVISYIGTYYAIASAWLLTSANFFIWGWFAQAVDAYYLNSWQVWFSILIVFTGLGNVALAAMRYRNKERTLLSALLENFKWVLMMAIFLGGTSMHLSAALLSHLFGFNMQWGATAKEVEDSNMFKELPRILKNFKFSLVYCLLFAAFMVMCALGPVPWNWAIDDFVAILPMATIIVSHVLLPIALNPALMKAQF